MKAQSGNPIVDAQINKYNNDAEYAKRIDNYHKQADEIDMAQCHLNGLLGLLSDLTCDRPLISESLNPENLHFTLSLLRRTAQIALSEKPEYPI